MINELQGTLKKNSTVKCTVINSSAQKIYRMYVTVKKVFDITMFTSMHFRLLV